MTDVDCATFLDALDAVVAGKDLPVEALEAIRRGAQALRVKELLVKALQAALDREVRWRTLSMAALAEARKMPDVPAPRPPERVPVSVEPLPPYTGCWMQGCRCARCVEIERREAAGEPVL